MNGCHNLDVIRDQDLNPATDFDTVGESKMADIAIVGGGPSGAMCGAELARAGHTVNIFDQHLAWEKPCGGGLTHKAIQNFPFLLDNPYPKKLVSSIELISSDDHRATLDLTNPIVIYSRTVLNGMLLSSRGRSGMQGSTGARFQCRYRGGRNRDFAWKASGGRRIFWCSRAEHGISLCPRRARYNGMSWR